MQGIFRRAIARLHKLLIRDTELRHELLKKILNDFFEILSQ